jgi:hypothetical protein
MAAAWKRKDKSNRSSKRNANYQPTGSPGQEKNSQKNEYACLERFASEKGCLCQSLYYYPEETKLCS